MSNKVLITGGDGFVGTNLQRVFERNDTSYTVYDIKNGDDIFDDKLDAVMRDHTHVVHLAAKTSVNESFEKPGDYIRTNVLGTARVLDLAIKNNKKLVYSSSAAFYHRELSPYAESKALADDLVRSFFGFHPVTILRFYNIYGIGMNPNTGSVMYQFCQGLKNKELVVYGDGEQTRDFINIEDICGIINESLSSSWDGKVVDCGNGQAYSLNYIAGMFAHFGDAKIKYEPPKREIKWSIADTSLLKTLYKNPMVTNLEEDLPGLAKYYANQ